MNSLCDGRSGLTSLDSSLAQEDSLRRRLGDKKMSDSGDVWGLLLKKGGILIRMEVKSIEF